MDGKVITLNRSNQEEIAQVLASAFATYPLMKYIFAISQVSLAESLQAMFYVSGEVRLQFDWPMLGVLDAEGKMVGAALMGLTRGVEWPESLQQVHNARFKQVVGPESAKRMDTFAKLSDTGRPEEPHVSLGVIGVLPETQGKGYGGRLLDEVHRISENDPTSTGVWLDTETEHNLGYYQKFGYEVKAHSVLDGEVDIWGMFRSN